MSKIKASSSGRPRQRCEVWSRVMGYMRPVSNYNIGKKSEFYSRQYFDFDKTMAAAEDNARFIEKFSK